MKIMKIKVEGSYSPGSCYLPLASGWEVCTLYKRRHFCTLMSCVPVEQAMVVQSKKNGL